LLYLDGNMVYYRALPVTFYQIGCMYGNAQTKKFW
jgi:hypothetical protein